MRQQTIIVSGLIMLSGLLTLSGLGTIGSIAGAAYATGLQEEKEVGKPQTTERDASAQGVFSRSERETIVKAATTTVHNSVQNTVQKQDTSNIAPKFWGKPIQKLRPLRVVNDRMNIMIVLAEDSRNEKGLYVVNPISSYLVTNTRFATYELLSKPEDKSFGSLYRYQILKK